jgi:hypothetical protein
VRGDEKYSFEWSSILTTDNPLFDFQILGIFYMPTLLVVLYGMYIVVFSATMKYVPKTAIIIALLLVLIPKTLMFCIEFFIIQYSSSPYESYSMFSWQQFILGLLVNLAEAIGIFLLLRIILKLADRLEKEVAIQHAK